MALPQRILVSKVFARCRVEKSGKRIVATIHGGEIAVEETACWVRELRIERREICRVRSDYVDGKVVVVFERSASADVNGAFDDPLDGLLWIRYLKSWLAGTDCQLSLGEAVGNSMETYVLADVGVGSQTYWYPLVLGLLALPGMLVSVLFVPSVLLFISSVGVSILWSRMGVFSLVRVSDESVTVEILSEYKLTRSGETVTMDRRKTCIRPGSVLGTPVLGALMTDGTSTVRVCGDPGILQLLGSAGIKVI